MTKQNTQSKPPPDAAAAPDPLALAEQARAHRSQNTVSYQLVTEGRDRGIDALAIIVAVLNGLNPEERLAAFAYLSSRYYAEQS